MHDALLGLRERDFAPLQLVGGDAAFGRAPERLARLEEDGVEQEADGADTEFSLAGSLNPPP